MSKIAKTKKKLIKKKEFEPIYMVNEPGVAYVTTTQLKNQLGEVLDLALIDGKEVILTKHGRPALKLELIEEKKKKKLNPDEINKKYGGSMPWFHYDPSFRDGFNRSFEKRLQKAAKLLSDDKE